MMRPRSPRRPRLLIHRAALAAVLIAAGMASGATPPTPKSSRAPRPTPTPIPTPAPTAEDPVTLPYGFSWGDSMDMVVQALPRVKAKIKDKKPLGDRGEIWVLTGIEVPGLRESRAIFQERQLVGLDLEYGAADWPVEKFRAAMANLRRKLETMFAGTGTMLKRGPVEGNDDSNVEQILTGYEWRRGDTIVLLVYFSAEKRGANSPKDIFRSMTIRYRYQQMPPEPLPTPKPKSGKDPLPDAESKPPPTPTPTPMPVPEATPAASPEESSGPPPTPTPEPLQNVLPEVMPTPTPDAAEGPTPTPTS